MAFSFGNSGNAGGAGGQPEDKLETIQTEVSNSQLPHNVTQNSTDMLRLAIS
jgi:hypothetical protein